MTKTKDCEKQAHNKEVQYSFIGCHCHDECFLQSGWTFVSFEKAIMSNTRIHVTLERYYQQKTTKFGKTESSPG